MAQSIEERNETLMEELNAAAIDLSDLLDHIRASYDIGAAQLQALRTRINELEKET